MWDLFVYQRKMATYLEDGGSVAGGSELDLTNGHFLT
jgi:hypothetical protein